MERAMWAVARPALFLVIALTASHGPEITQAQTRILPLGDSITHGGQGYASYRYPLWFALAGGGLGVEFVGSRTDLFGGGDPIAKLYPSYFTTFDRDHSGFWGWRTDQIAEVIEGISSAQLPDIVMIHLGSNDVGQQGAAGIANANANLRLIISRIRAIRPNVRILLAQIIPIGPGTSYFDSADQIAPLNIVIAQIAADLSTAQSPIVVVDQNTGFDLASFMQSDGLHPNQTGEAFMATRWLAALQPFLTGGGLPPSAILTAPTPGASFRAPATINLAATATDTDGSITQVEFFAAGASLGVDTAKPYSVTWNNVRSGRYALTAVATDNDGLTRASTPVEVDVIAAGSSVFITNPSFENPILGDAALVEGPGLIGGWTFAATPLTYVGIFNPPIGSYPGAGGSGTPAGAEGRNAAYLFKNGLQQSVSCDQTLGATLLPNTRYRLTVAIGRFLADQPYVFSTYGGYRIELLAGETAIAADSDTVNPPFGAFRDATTTVASRNLAPSLLGRPLRVRLTISADDWPRSTHFDNVRLVIESPLGDMNCDDRIDFEDINGFVAALVGETTFAAAFPECRWLNGDINGSGSVNFEDIDGFVGCLVAGECGTL